ncbi:energy-coupling factor ABC transporter ATP-binding protein [Cellulomonas hominis]|uniref:Energy-coupling factor ABC transporter ATP-binding protein n=1 Tax=Cellulomonas hominis TaxID=156981 RepID=A0A7Z8K2A8_9CELL|nr:energy-coupling factor ABC transporter ATP-binding protein [Cellulomonas hominis]
MPRAPSRAGTNAAHPTSPSARTPTGIPRPRPPPARHRRRVRRLRASSPVARGSAARNRRTRAPRGCGTRQGRPGSVGVPRTTRRVGAALAWRAATAPRAARRSPASRNPARSDVRAPPRRRPRRRRRPGPRGPRVGRHGRRADRHVRRLRRRVRRAARDPDRRRGPHHAADVRRRPHRSGARPAPRGAGPAAVRRRRPRGRAGVLGRDRRARRAGVAVGGVPARVPGGRRDRRRVRAARAPRAGPVAGAGAVRRGRRRLAARGAPAGHRGHGLAARAVRGRGGRSRCRLPARRRDQERARRGGRRRRAARLPGPAARPVIELDGAVVTAYSPGEARRGAAERVVTLLGPVTATLTERRIAVVGANGSGKSTLARLLNGLTLPAAGAVRVDGLDTARDGAAVRRRVGFLFTDPDAQVVMPTGVEDVALSLRRLGVPARERDSRAREALARVGLASRADLPVRALSGGQRQLLALAAVLATEPAVLVCDEPTTLLDLRWRRVVDTLLADLPQQVVQVTHDLDAAARADRVLVVDGGRVVHDGRPGPALDAYRSLMAVEPA